MPLHTPQFWQKDGLIARMMQPFAAIYGAGARLHQALARPKKVGVPVVAVGNVMAGGAGKTPVTQALVRQMQDWGFTPHIISRGYGGRLAGPVKVDMAKYGAIHVGDEPLMHAAIAPTWVARNRFKATQAAIMEGARLLVMDDGLQNTKLKPDIGLLVMDGRIGIGNGRLMPAGALREPLDKALARAHAVVMVGDDETNLKSRIPDYIPILHGDIKPDAHAASLLRDTRVIGFCGLARPEKFFNTLEQIGVELVDAIAFPDHHLYRAKELQRLVDAARDARAYLVTTQKDWVNIPTHYHPHIQSLPIRFHWRDSSKLQSILMPHIVRQT